MTNNLSGLPNHPDRFDCLNRSSTPRSEKSDARTDAEPSSSARINVRGKSTAGTSNRLVARKPAIPVQITPGVGLQVDGQRPARSCVLPCFESPSHFNERSQPLLHDSEMYIFVSPFVKETELIIPCESAVNRPAQAIFRDIRSLQTGRVVQTSEKQVGLGFMRGIEMPSSMTIGTFGS